MNSKDFLWGASTSAYQVEGAWNEDGKGPSVQDIRKVPEDTTDFKVAADHYHRMEEDVKLFAEMGLKAYRFSIAWTRIFPEGYGKVNQKGLEFYSKLIDKLIENNIEPVITVFHFDMPAKLEQEGGWGNRKTIDYFVDYCNLLFDEFGDRVKYWLTINEQNMLTLVGKILYGAKKTLKDIYQENHHMLVAQARVMRDYHAKGFNGKIGPAPNISAVYPASTKPEDVLAADEFSAFRNWLYLDAAVWGEYNNQALSVLKRLNAEPEITQQDIKDLKDGTCDFIAFNYYNNMTAEYYSKDEKVVEGDQQKGIGIPGVVRVIKNKNLPTTEFGWEIDPVGFRITANQIYTRYRLPLLVTENGLGGYDTMDANNEIHDDYRIDYLSKNINEMKKAIEIDGVELFGYCAWSAIDLVSTHEGVRKRYGFIYVDREDFELKTLNRYKKDSFYWYQEFIKSETK